MVLCKKYDYPHKKLPRVLLWRNFKKKSRSVAIYVVFVFLPDSYGWWRRHKYQLMA